MRFRKFGKDIIASIRRYIEVKRELLEKENEIFEREKEKRALQAIHELELSIQRLEGLLPHIEEDLEYWLSEEDLHDFGFFYSSQS